MPRTQLHRRIAAWFGILALLLSYLGPTASTAQAAPQGQDDPTAGIIVSIDEPMHRSGTTARRVVVRGWAADPTSQRGTGVARVDLYLDGGPDQGGLYLGQANYGRERADVANALGGQRFLASGFEMTVEMARGPHTIVAVAAPSGGAPALVVPGVASVHATVGGPAGITASGCGAGGYCSSDEGGESQTMRQGWVREPIYSGNLYVGTGAYGNGPTTPPYGWWDSLLDDMGAYILAYRMYGYPYPQQFWGNVPRLYDQNLISTLSTQGVLAGIGAGNCFGPEFSGLDVLGQGVVGGYSFGFPFLSGLGTTGNSPGTLGFSAFGTTGVNGTPLSIPFRGTVGTNTLYARGLGAAYNGALANFTVSGAGAAGIGGAIGTSTGIFQGSRPFTGQFGQNTACNLRF